jgi:hypothetical protein
MLPAPLLELYETLGRQADHVGQERGVAAPLNQLANRNPLVGRCGRVRSRVAARNDPIGDPAGSTDLWLLGHYAST